MVTVYRQNMPHDRTRAITPAFPAESAWRLNRPEPTWRRVSAHPPRRTGHGLPAARRRRCEEKARKISHSGSANHDDVRPLPTKKQALETLTVNSYRGSRGRKGDRHHFPSL